jgi:hypothetical protein
MKTHPCPSTGNPGKRVLTRTPHCGGPDRLAGVRALGPGELPAERDVALRSSIQRQVQLLEQCRPARVPVQPTQVGVPANPQDSFVALSDCAVEPLEGPVSVAAMGINLCDPEGGNDGASSRGGGRRWERSSILPVRTEFWLGQRPKRAAPAQATKT